MKEQKGYVIVKLFKNGKEKNAIKVCYRYGEANSEKLSLAEKCAISGINGYGELYYSYGRAKSDCDELNVLWKCKAFKVKTASLVF